VSASAEAVNKWQLATLAALNLVHSKRTSASMTVQLVNKCRKGTPSICGGTDCQSSIFFSLSGVRLAPIGTLGKFDSVPGRNDLAEFRRGPASTLIYTHGTESHDPSAMGIPKPDLSVWRDPLGTSALSSEGCLGCRRHFVVTLSRDQLYDVRPKGLKMAFKAIKWYLQSNSFIRSLRVAVEHYTVLRVYCS